MGQRIPLPARQQPQVHLRPIGPVIPGVATLGQLRAHPLEVDAGRVKKNQTDIREQLLGQHEGQPPLQLPLDLRQKPQGPVDLMQLDPRKPGRLHALQPLPHQGPVRRGPHDPPEDDGLHHIGQGEPREPRAGQISQDPVQPQLPPQVLQGPHMSEGATGQEGDVRIARDLPASVGRQRRHESVDLGGIDLVLPAQGGDNPLPGSSPLPVGLHELQVRVGVLPASDAGALEEHLATIVRDPLAVVKGFPALHCHYDRVFDLANPLRESVFDPPLTKCPPVMDVKPEVSWTVVDTPVVPVNG